MPVRPIAALLALAAFLGLCGCTKTLHQAAFFMPQKRAPIPDGIERRNVEIVADDSTPLRGWLLRPPAVDGSLIYFYGNGETVRDSERRLFWLASEFRLAVLAVDYRGYGFSEGTPSADDLMRDAVRIYDFLAGAPGGGARPIVAYGRSLGTFVATDLASKRPLDGLILEGSVTSLPDALPQMQRIIPWPLRWFVRLRLGEDLKVVPKPEERIKQLTLPLLVIHGEADRLFPVALGRRMYEDSPAVLKRWCPVPGADHNTLSVYDPPASQCLGDFLAAVEGKHPPG